MKLFYIVIICLILGLSFGAGFGDYIKAFFNAITGGTLWATVVFWVVLIIMVSLLITFIVLKKKKNKKDKDLLRKKTELEIKQLEKKVEETPTNNV